MVYAFATFSLLWIYGLVSVTKKKRVETAEAFMAQVERIYGLN